MWENRGDRDSLRIQPLRQYHRPGWTSTSCPNAVSDGSSALIRSDTRSSCRIVGSSAIAGWPVCGRLHPCCDLRFKPGIHQRAVSRCLTRSSWPGRFSPAYRRDASKTKRRTRPIETREILRATRIGLPVRSPMRRLLPR